MEQEPGESDVSRQQDAALGPQARPKSAPNGDSPSSALKETADDSSVATLKQKTGSNGARLDRLVDYPLDDEDEELSELKVPENLLRAADISKSAQMPLSRARYRMAMAAMAILGLVVIGSFALLWRGKASTEDLTRVLEIIFAPIVALVGVSLAFFSRSNP
jgi:hypothetical protein